MRYGIKQPFDWSLAGAELARQDDETQAQFFKSFLKECNTWGTHHQVEIQLSFINGKLTKEEREQLGMLSFQED